MGERVVIMVVMEMVLDFISAVHESLRDGR